MNIKIEMGTQPMWGYFVPDIPTYELDRRCTVVACGNKSEITLTLKDCSKENLPGHWLWAST